MKYATTMKKTIFALLAILFILPAFAQDSNKVVLKNSYSNAYPLCIDFNVRGALLNQNLTLVPDMASQYSNISNNTIGKTKFSNGKSIGFDAQFGYFFDKEQHYGFGLGIMYLRQYGKYKLYDFNFIYQTTDNNGTPYKQVITANTITENVKISNFNIPLVFKYKTKFNKYFGFTADAGLLFNMQLKNSYSTNAVFNNQAVYENSTINSLGIKPDKSTGDVNFEYGTPGILIQPAVSYSINEQLDLNFGLHYIHQNFKNNQSNNYQLADNIGTYSSILNSITNSSNNMYGLNIGLRYFFGKQKDSDHDGMPDKKDKCPFDSGLIEFNGCPDHDHDGIPDCEDSCPHTPGLLKFHGCPDTDGNGIMDKEDACPYEFGTIKLQGCPDADGDGIPDKDDSCPHQAGTILFHGCPDSDGDGLPDNQDMCPFVAGPMENYGCPIEKEPQKDIIEDIDRSEIQFEFDKFTIRKTSYPYLDSVIMVLNEYPGANLFIDGYCDTTGPESVNNLISKIRAQQVQKYMIAHGIDPKRIIATGHGFCCPIGDNRTRAGRARNRRASMTVKNNINEISFTSNKEPGSFTIKLTTNLNENANVVITNTKNEVVKTFTITPNKTIQFILEQPDGLYFLSANTPTIKYNAKLVIVK